MQNLLNTIELLKNSPISELISQRLHEFKRLRHGSINSIFKEMCFCIMTANCSAKMCIEVHETIDNGFLTLSEDQLVQEFKDKKYRFPNVRAKYILEARKLKEDLDLMIKENTGTNNLRDWLVKNVKGLGYKEASHFLRNIGYTDFAIIDFHIIDTLVKFNIIEKPKTLTKKKYLEIETILRTIGNKLNLNLGELDLFLWYYETGKVLK
ncbi:MAG: N-glycosylase/DNA lyase [Promethearchaeota archaeon]